MNEKWYNISLILLIAVSIVLVTSLIAVMEHHISTIQDMDSQIQTLLDQNRYLQEWLYGNLSHIEMLTFQVTKLKTQILELVQSYDNLAKNLSLMQENYHGLLTNYTTLKERYHTLNQTYLFLLRNYTELGQKNRQLITNYTDILHKYYVINEKYEKINESYQKLSKAFNAPLTSKITPTIDEVRHWLLYEDDTDEITFGFPDFVCGDFAVMLSQHAKLKYWDMG